MNYPIIKKIKSHQKHFHVNAKMNPCGSHYQKIHVAPNILLYTNCSLAISLATWDSGEKLKKNKVSSR